MNKALEDITVLATRPVDQNAALVDAIVAHGGTPLAAPMIIVAPPADARAAKRQARAGAAADVLIFVSRNAVEFGVPLLAAAGVDIADKEVFAVGLGTASALANAGIGEVETPSREFSSEGLLRLDGLAEDAIDRREVLIVRGVGGREVLGDTLRRRGASVSYLECYERRKPDVVLSEVLAAADVRVPDVALATSLEALQNLADKLEDEGLDRLFDMQMLVVGSRVGQEVAALGFTLDPVVVENPSNDSIINRLIQWADD